MSQAVNTPGMMTIPLFAEQGKIEYGERPVPVPGQGHEACELFFQGDTGKVPIEL
ncbi:hypothetical protein [Paenibacillus sp. GCM10023250]|uniref:hypothetical protein n=1 Tax=Paenibacillus sp. GCM10023250 TaxID=3252648 RepID=UPI0036233143